MKHLCSTRCVALSATYKHCGLYIIMSVSFLPQSWGSCYSLCPLKNISIQLEGFPWLSPTGLAKLQKRLTNKEPSLWIYTDSAVYCFQWAKGNQNPNCTQYLYFPNCIVVHFLNCFQCSNTKCMFNFMPV